MADLDREPPCTEHKIWDAKSPLHQPVQEFIFWQMRLTNCLFSLFLSFWNREIKFEVGDKFHGSRRAEMQLQDHNVWKIVSTHKVLEPLTTSQNYVTFHPEKHCRTCNTPFPLSLSSTDLKQKWNINYSRFWFHFKQIETPVTFFFCKYCSWNIQNYVLVKFW